MSDWKHVIDLLNEPALRAHRETAESGHWEVPYTVWGDYCGDAVNRANYVSLVENYGEYVTEHHGSFDSHWLSMDVDDSIPADLYWAIVRLMDYPVLDESTWSEVEREIQDDDWENYGRDELRSLVRAELDSRMNGASVAGVDLDELLDSCTDALLNVKINEGYWCEVVEWTCETATSGYFRGLEDLAAQLAKELIMQAQEDWYRHALSLTQEQVPGQLALDVQL